MILTTEALVLKGRRYSDSSKIVVLYTRERGKLSAVAKGALRGRARFGSALEPMSHVSAVLYVKENRDLQILSQCDLFRPFRSLSEDAGKMAIGMACVELLDGVTRPEERNDALFSLALRVLGAVEGATKRYENTLYYFETGLLDVLGFKPLLHSCVTCGVPLTGGSSGAREIRLSESGALCRNCVRKHHGLFPISPPAFRVLQRLQEVTDPAAVARWSLTPGVSGEVAAALRRFLQYHVEGLGPLKSQKVFSAFPAS